MTVIAYRAGVMACDSCWTYGDTQVLSMIKIRRTSAGALFGCAGDNDVRALDELVDKIKTAAKLPSRKDLEATKADFIALLALPKGGVYCIANGRHDDNGYTEEDTGVWSACSLSGYAAIGSGGDFALAAMDAGADARAACMVACRRNINCRPPIHMLSLLRKK